MLHASTNPTIVHVPHAMGKSPPPAELLNPVATRWFPLQLRTLKKFTLW
jgi:hypothetical protein